MCYYKQIRKYCPCRLQSRCAAWSSHQHEFLPSVRHALHLCLQPWSTDQPCDFWKARLGGVDGVVCASRYCPFSLPPGRYNEVVDLVLPKVCGICRERCAA